MEKEQSTSVAVANSNHLSSTAAFSAGKQFAPFHLTPFSLQCSLHFFLHFQVLCQHTWASKQSYKIIELVLSSFGQNLGPARLYDLSKVTQQISGRGGN